MNQTQNTKQTIAFYDMHAYSESQINYYAKEKDWFKETYHTFSDIDTNEISYEDIEKAVWEDELLGVIHYENLVEDLHHEFKDKKGMRVLIKGSNMTWRNLEGTKAFYLKDPMDIWDQIVPKNTEVTFNLFKTSENEYEIEMSHHDSPTGEYYNLKLSK